MVFVMNYGQLLLEHTAKSDTNSSIVYDDDGSTSGFPFSMTLAGAWADSDLYFAGSIFTIVSGTGMSTGDFIVAEVINDNVLRLTADAGSDATDVVATAQTPLLIAGVNTMVDMTNLQFSVIVRNATVGGGSVAVTFQNSADNGVNFATLNSIGSVNADGRFLNLPLSNAVFRHGRVAVVNSLTGVSTMDIAAYMHGTTRLL